MPYARDKDIKVTIIKISNCERVTMMQHCKEMPRLSLSNENVMGRTAVTQGV